MGFHANRAKGNKEGAREINSLIDTLILKLNKIYNKLVENDEIITATRIKDLSREGCKEPNPAEGFQDSQ